MPRTDTDAVKDILDTSLTDTQIEAFIRSASLMVDQLDATVLSDDLLEEVEKYLAAHLCCLRDPRHQSRSMGRASETLQGQTGQGLDSTHYGQTAKVLDVTGRLAQLTASNRTKANLRFVGSDVSEQLTGDSWDEYVGCTGVEE